MTREPWTPEQTHHLQRFYKTYPIEVLQRAINKRGPHRTESAITNAARRHQLTGDYIPHGYVTLAHAYPRGPGQASDLIVTAAKRAGVHRQLNTHRGRPHIAPEKWVDAWLAQKLQTDDEDRERDDYYQTHWLRSRHFAADLGLQPNQVAQSLLAWNTPRARDGRKCRRVRLLTLPGTPWFWHPDDIRWLISRHGVRRAA